MIKPRPTISVVHLRPEEAEPLVAKLRSAKFEVNLVPFPPRFRKTEAPAAVVLSLTRSPSHARWVGYSLRKSKWSRLIPLVFVDGEPEKVAAVRRVLPDATFTTLPKVATALREAMKRPVQEVAVPESYSDPGRSLVEKFGIAAGHHVAVIGEPPEFRRVLGEVPEDVEFTEWPDRRTTLTVWFVRSLGELEEGFEAVLNRIGSGPIWICWPKQSSGVRSDLTMTNIRQVAIRYNRIDVKILRIDRTWSGSLIFVRRAR